MALKNQGPEEVARASDLARWAAGDAVGGGLGDSVRETSVLPAQAPLSEREVKYIRVFPEVGALVSVGEGGGFEVLEGQLQGAADVAAHGF
jgi:hypothetical protein